MESSRRLGPPNQPSASFPSSSINLEATKPMLNLCDRGKKLYLEGKTEKGIKVVNLAPKIFQRGLRFPECKDKCVG